MDTFTASNGVTITRAGSTFQIADETGANMLDDMNWLGRLDMQALREFFRAERDEELGRWRWVENPDYVVYRHESGQAIVINERTGISFWRYRGEASELRALRADEGKDVSQGTKAAEAYFEAHPERKPWEDAKPGEVWVVKWLNSANPEEVVIVRPGGWDKNWAVDSARRIWPEVS